MAKLFQSEKKIISLNKHTGKWVAFINERIVADGDSLSELMRKVKKKKFPKEPSVLLVPRKDEGPLIF